MLESLPFHNLEQFIQWGGLIVLIIIVFAESGLFFGFFLPGDSLLFVAGLLAAKGYFSIWTLLISLVIAAILGDQVGYWTGKYLGNYLKNRPDGKLFKKEYIAQAHQFYEKHGVMAIILARFIPIVRTFAPIVAGAVKMDYSKFLTYNIVGGIIWVCSMVGAGYLLVQFIPGIKDYLHVVIGLIIVASLIPVVSEFLKNRKKAKHA
jgi:membrane-associated protein